MVMWFSSSAIEKARGLEGVAAAMAHKVVYILQYIYIYILNLLNFLIRGLVTLQADVANAALIESRNGIKYLQEVSFVENPTWNRFERIL